MWSFVTQLFDVSGFPARWQCGDAWQQEPWIGYLHIASDLATFIAYYAVPCVVVYFVARHHNVNFPRIFYVFLGLIFFSCGTVHLIEAGIFWWPLYRLSAFVKLLTATVSGVGVVVLTRILPNALELKSGEAYRREVSGRQEAEESLRTSEQRFQLCVRGSNDGIWDWNVKTNEVYYAPRFKELLGYQDHEMENVFEAWRSRLHSEDIQPTLAAVAAHLEQRAPYDVEYRLRTKSDGYKWFRARGQAVWDESGEATRMAGSITEITEKKRAEEKLRVARDNAEAASRAKSIFLANMSHEIRTPMNGVIGMTELLLNSELSEEQQGYLRMVKDSADSLLHLLNDILDFSKIEAGKLELESVVFNLRDTIGRTAQTLAVRAAEKGLELNCRIDPKLPKNLRGDPGRLRQIIVNLAGNAVKFTHHGEVMVDVGEKSRSGNQVCLFVSVKDTGIGIPEEKRAVIFDAFSQADESMTREYGGTGLGLAICSQLINLMQGRIWIESEVGKGTVVYFTAVLEISDDPEAQDSTSLGALEGMPVLVVDDNATNRRVLEEILASWKLAPASVEDGAEALRELERAARDEPYQIVLLDCMMPGMDGFAVAEEIRKNKDLQDASVIMISSADLPGDSKRCRELGIARYMTKPVVQSELLDALLSVSGSPAKATAEAPEQVEQPEFELPILKVLLVEDGVINQRVAMGFLEMHGHQVSIANNGREAVKAHAAGEFDVVLMDVQMPEMDGIQATSIIRQNDDRLGRHTPIIAMTAAAMKGDRERCLDAGMDAYIAKPIVARELFEVLRRFAPARETDQSATASHEPSTPGRSDPDSGATTVPEHGLFDPRAAESRIPGGSKVVKQMTELFMDECLKLLREIEEGILQNDAERAGRGAHTLKGSADVFSAHRVVERARQLEELGRAGDLRDAKPLFADLSEEVHGLVLALRKWVESQPD